MRSVAHLDILGDTPLTRHVVTLSAAILVVGLLGEIYLVVTHGWGMGVGAWMAVYVAATVAALPVHELVHAAAFLLLGRGRVCIRFGYETGMLYTRAEGNPLTRGRFVAVLLAPSVLVTGALVLVGVLVAGPALAWALAWTRGVPETWPWLCALLARRDARTCAIRIRAWSFSPMTVMVTAHSCKFRSVGVL